MPGVQGARVCNTLRAYGDHDFNPDIGYRLFFAPGLLKGLVHAGSTCPPVRPLHTFAQDRKYGPARPERKLKTGRIIVTADKEECTEKAQ